MSLIILISLKYHRRERYNIHLIEKKIEKNTNRYLMSINNVHYNFEIKELIFMYFHLYFFLGPLSGSDITNNQTDTQQC